MEGDYLFFLDIVKINSTLTNIESHCHITQQKRQMGQARLKA